MRKLPFILLLATAAAPALAQDSDRPDRQRGDRADQSENRSERANRPQRASNQRNDASERRPVAERAERGQPNQRGSMEISRDRGDQRQLQRDQRQRATSAPPAVSEPANNWRRGNRPGVDPRAGSGLQPRERQVRTIPNVQPNVVPQQRDRRGFEGHRRDYRDGNYNRWSRNWHRDNRYDWRRHRDRNRSSFRLGFYYDPFGYNYRRWSLGSFLVPSYYSSRYWLNDPWQYRLPPAYGPYRWVRYWNDALLVNTYTGEVVDVIHSFFW